MQSISIFFVQVNILQCYTFQKIKLLSFQIMWSEYMLSFDKKAL